MLREKTILITLYVYFANFFAAVLANDCTGITKFNEKYKTDITDEHLKKIYSDAEKAKNSFGFVKLDIEKMPNVCAVDFLNLENNLEATKIDWQVQDKIKQNKLKHFAQYFGCINFGKDHELLFMQYYPYNLTIQESYNYDKILERQKSKIKENFIVPPFYAEFSKKPLEDKFKIYKRIAMLFFELHENGFVLNNFDPSQIYFEDDKEYFPKLLQLMNIKQVDFVFEEGKPTIFDDKHWLRYKLTNEEKKKRKVLERKENKTANIWSFGMLIYVLHNNHQGFIDFPLKEFTFDNIDDNLKIVRNSILDIKNWHDKEIMLLELKKPFPTDSPNRYLIKTFEELMGHMMEIKRGNRLITAKNIVNALSRFSEEYEEEIKKRTQLKII